MRGGRTAARAGIEMSGRMQLVEDDLDGLEESIDRVGDKLGKILWAVVGLLVSVTTTAILLVMNLAAGQP